MDNLTYLVIMLMAVTVVVAAAVLGLIYIILKFKKVAKGGMAIFMNEEILPPFSYREVAAAETKKSRDIVKGQHCFRKIRPIHINGGIYWRDA